MKVNPEIRKFCERNYIMNIDKSTRKGVKLN